MGLIQSIPPKFYHRSVNCSVNLSSRVDPFKMAPGSSSRRADDEDGGREERPTLQRASSVDEVSGQAPAVVSTFLSECFRADGLPVPQELSENQKKINKDVAHVIRDIGDRLSNDTSLNNLISQVQVSKDTAFDTFLQVAAQIFSDGKVNWGRIVTLFYFGYKLAVQVINEIPLIKMIIEWVVQFIKDRLAKWIFEQGGWVRIFFLYILCQELPLLSPRLIHICKGFY